jgi:sigma-E factor negative regulatory protein RseC
MSPGSRGIAVREQATVIEGRGELALVRMKRSEACAGCRACAAIAGGNMEVEAGNPVRARPGDRVEIEINDARYLRAAFLVFIMPLIGALAGYGAGASLAGSEGAGIVCGAAGMALVFVILRAYDKRVGRMGTLRPRIVRIIMGVKTELCGNR